MPTFNSRDMQRAFLKANPMARTKANHLNAPTSGNSPSAFSDVVRALYGDQAEKKRILNSMDPVKTDFK